MSVDRLQLHLQTDPKWLVRACGELDYDNCSHFGELVRSTLHGCDDSVELCLGGLDFVDSSGLRELIVSAQEAQANDRVLRIVSLTSQLDHVLRVARVDALFDIAAEPVLPGNYQPQPLPADVVHEMDSELDACGGGREVICRFAENLGFRSPALDDFRLAVGEALSNAVRHGDCKGHRIHIHCCQTDGGVEVNLTYPSQRFDPDGVMQPDLKQFPTGGMGIYFMRLVLDHLSYNFDNGHVTVTLLKNN